MKPEIREMSVTDFITIRGNPKQRDVPRHVKKAKAKHLKESHDVQMVVNIAKFGAAETLIKLDGHTRGRMWETGELDRPDVVMAIIWTVKNKKELLEHYDTFDNSDAAENSTDKITGAMRNFNIPYESTGFVVNCGLRNALLHLVSIGLNTQTHNGKRKYGEIELIGEFREEVTWLAAQPWQATKQTATQNYPGVPSVVTASILATLRMDGNDCLAFWDAYYHAKGSADKGLKDGVAMAVDWVHHCRAKNELGNRKYYLRNMEFLINAYCKWKEGENIKRNIDLYNKQFIKLDAMNKWFEELGFTLKTIKPVKDVVPKDQDSRAAIAHAKNTTTKLKVRPNAKVVKSVKGKTAKKSAAKKAAKKSVAKKSVKKANGPQQQEKQLDMVG